jgi:hypothetical protein
VNNFEDSLSSLSLSEKLLLRTIYDKFGIVSFSNLIVSQNRMHGEPLMSFLTTLRDKKQEDLLSLITRGVVSLVTNSGGNTQGIVITSPEFYGMINRFMGPEIRPSCRDSEAGMISIQQPYEKLVSILIATEFFEKEGRKHDGSKVAKVTHFSQQITDSLLNIARIMLWVEGPRTRYKLTEKGKAMLRDSEETRTTFLNILERTPGSTQEYDSSVNLIISSTDFNRIVNFILEKWDRLKVSEVVDLVLANPSVSENCRKLVTKAIHESLYYTGGSGREKELLKSPRDYFHNEYKKGVLWHLGSLFVSGKISASSEDISLETCVSRNDENHKIKEEEKLHQEKTKEVNWTKVSLLPNYELLIDPHTPLEHITYLAELSELISIDRVIVSRITKTSLVRYLNAHGSGLAT